MLKTLLSVPTCLPSSVTDLNTKGSIPSPLKKEDSMAPMGPCPCPCMAFTKSLELPKSGIPDVNDLTMVMTVMNFCISVKSVQSFDVGAPESEQMTDKRVCA